MREDRLAEAGLARLPREFVDRLTKPFARFLSIEATGGAVLLLLTVATLVLSNSPWAHLPLSPGEIANAVTLAVFSGFAVGKPAGILTFSWLAVRSGIAIRPADLDWRLLAGIGFTMALVTPD